MAAAIFTLLLVPVPSSLASCSLKITKAAPCLANGAYGLPAIGATYGIRVTFNVTGTPSKPFSVRFTIANVTNTYSNLSLKAGNGYYFYDTAVMSLDDAIPWSVTLDPDHVSGNTNPNTTVSGTFTPKPPATMVEAYSPATMQGSEARQISFQTGSGTISNLLVLFGAPSSHGAQEVLSSTGPSGGVPLLTPPYNLPIYQVLLTNVPAGTFSFNDSFSVKLSRLRVNPGLLRKITWDSLGTVTADVAQWIAADAVNESTDSRITAFVQQSLPADYQTTLSPYDAARILHKAVMKAMTYQEPPPYSDAAGSLQAGVADCGGYAAALTSCLRNIGIPARRIAGFWKGFGQQHVMVEFYLPGAGWLVADPDEGNAVDPTGTYAYFFGSNLATDSFICTDVGDSHQLTFNNLNAQNLQVPSLYYWSNSNLPILSNTFFSYLQPGVTSEYTVLLKPTSTGAGIPQGTGWGLLTMSNTGALTLTGHLADGESFSTSGAMGGNAGDQFLVSTPLTYAAASTPGTPGSLSGAFNFVSTTGPYQSMATGEIGGTLTWKKPQESSGAYPAAFQTSLQIYGSTYLPPATGRTVLPGFTRGAMQLSDGGTLSTSTGGQLVKNVTLNAANALKVTKVGKDKLKVTITPSTGVFNGTFEYPVAGGKPILTNFSGVLFQDQVNGGGYFLGPQGGGAVDLER